MKKSGIVIIITSCFGSCRHLVFFLQKERQKIFVITEKPQIWLYLKKRYCYRNDQPVDTVAVGAQVSGTIAKIYTDFNAKCYQRTVDC